MIRVYQLIRLIPFVRRSERLASGVMLVALTVSVLIFFGIIADGDGIAYYMWANSIVIDHDLNLVNQAADAVRIMNVGPEFELPRWPNTGAVRNPYTTGTSFSQLPFAFLGHAAAKVLNRAGIAVPVDGYSLPYAAAVAAGSVLYTFAVAAACCGCCGSSTGVLSPCWRRSGCGLGPLSCAWHISPLHSHGPDLLVTVIFFSFWYFHGERTDCRPVGLGAARCSASACGCVSKTLCWPPCWHTTRR